MIKIVSWNVNSIRTRLNHLLKWLEEEAPDIVLLQELKCINDLFPRAEIEDLGYNIIVNGQKSYNGVAILSKYPIEEHSINLTNDPDNSHARYIEAIISIGKKIIRVASVYVPNGQEVDSPKFIYKLNYFDALYDHINGLLSYNEILVVGGDFNVAPDEIDVYDPINLEGSLCYSSSEKSKFRKLLNLGLVDAFRTKYSNKQEFSWWDYRAGAFMKNQGMRIDHLLLSPEAGDLLLDVNIEKSMRNLEKSSDHAPVNCVLEL